MHFKDSRSALLHVNHSSLFASLLRQFLPLPAFSSLQDFEIWRRRALILEDVVKVLLHQCIRYQLVLPPSSPTDCSFFVTPSR